MNKIRLLLAFTSICFFSMSAIVHSAHPNFAVDHIFDRMDYGVMSITASDMARLGYGRYLEMKNSGYSNEDIKTTMAYDFLDKYSKGDHAFCQSMLDSMMLGASGYSNHTYRRDLTIFKDELYGTQPTPKSPVNNKK